jgi:hypothetical protein
MQDMLGQMFDDDNGAPPMPGGLPDMTMVSEGSTSTRTVSLVLVDGGEVVGSEADMSMLMSFRYEGAEDGGPGMPESFSIEGTMRMEMTRTS